MALDLQVENITAILLPIVGASNLYGYRNKMTFCFSTRRWVPTAEDPDALESGFSLGLLRPGSFTDVLPVQQCELQDDEANTILRVVNDYCQVLHTLAGAVQSGSSTLFAR